MFHPTTRVVLAPAQTVATENEVGGLLVFAAPTLSVPLFLPVLRSTPRVTRPLSPPRFGAGA